MHLFIKFEFIEISSNLRFYLNKRYILQKTQAGVFKNKNQIRISFKHNNFKKQSQTLIIKTNVENKNKNKTTSFKVKTIFNKKNCQIS